MCSMNGSASAPNSATMNGTRWAIKPEMKALASAVKKAVKKVGNARKRVEKRLGR